MPISSPRRAQTVIEYILLTTAVIVVLVTGVLIKGGVFVRGVHSVLDVPGTMVDQRRGEVTFNAVNVEPCVPVTACPTPADFDCGKDLGTDSCGQVCGYGTKCWVPGAWCDITYCSIAAQ
jgi:hypothetical protein